MAGTVQSNNGGDLAERRRRQILDAAATVFARRGYGRARTREIAQEAGISEASIYKYFKSKEELLITLIQQVGFASLPQLPDLSGGTDLRSLLTAFLLDRFAMIDRNRELIKAVLPEMITDRKLREDYIRQVILPTMYLFTSMVQRSVPSETGRAVNPRVMVPAALGGTVVAMVFNDYLDLPTGPRLSRKQLAEQLVELYLGAIWGYEEEAPVGSPAR